MDNFITRIIDEDIKTYIAGEKVHTRFPPEPNGFLHLGHAKSICLNFGIAKKYDGACNLRFDDTNPSPEYERFTKAIIADLEWLGYKPEITYASDHFNILYQIALKLIRDGKAYVCDLSPDKVAAYRGDAKGGINSPNRNRSIEENLELFHRMVEGEFPDGSKTLRAKLDMKSPNFNMRDPVLYRILHKEHFRTVDEWVIYPMYDYAHPLCDHIEYITHSICTLEFEDHRPLYDWLIDSAGLPGRKPKQIEFARLEVAGMTMSKRKINALIQTDPSFKDWDDPRLPTIAGLRNRGYTPSAIHAFCEDIGIAKFNSVIDPIKLENAIRDELNKTTTRLMAVTSPLEVQLTNFNEKILVELPNNPEDETAGARSVEFSNTVFIEQDDFAIVPPPKFNRLSPNKNVRLKSAAVITCVSHNETKLLCTYDSDSSGKAKGTIHWVPANAVDVKLHIYNGLYKDAECEILNEVSHEVKIIKIEPFTLVDGARVQFMRHGYYFYKNGEFFEIARLKSAWENITKREQNGNDNKTS